MILTCSGDPEVTCQTGSRKVWILNLVAQTSVLGRREVLFSLKVSTVFLCSAFQREPEVACLSGRETVERSPWSTLFSATSHPTQPGHVKLCVSRPTPAAACSPICTTWAATFFPLWVPNPIVEFRSHGDESFCFFVLLIYFFLWLLIYSLNKYVLANNVSGTGLGLGWDSAMNKTDQETILMDIATFQLCDSSKVTFTQ